MGAPLYYMELALGQFSSRGPATGFIFAKGWQGTKFIFFTARMIHSSGVGFAMIINSTITMIYYNVVISWALFYFVLSFRKRLLWSDCGHWWNTDRCFVPRSSEKLFVPMINETAHNCTQTRYVNISDYQRSEINTTEKITVTEEFY